jgi:hypothetical protein
MDTKLQRLKMMRNEVIQNNSTYIWKPNAEEKEQPISVQKKALTKEEKRLQTIEQAFGRYVEPDEPILFRETITQEEEENIELSEADKRLRLIDETFRRPLAPIKKRVQEESSPEFFDFIPTGRLERRLEMRNAQRSMKMQKDQSIEKIGEEPTTEFIESREPVANKHRWGVSNHQDIDGEIDEDAEMVKILETIILNLKQTPGTLEPRVAMLSLTPVVSLTPTDYQVPTVPTVPTVPSVNRTPQTEQSQGKRTARPRNPVATRLTRRSDAAIVRNEVVKPLVRERAPELKEIQRRREILIGRPNLEEEDDDIFSTLRSPPIPRGMTVEGTFFGN